MKTKIISLIKGKSIAEIKDAFLVLLGIAAILFAVNILYWCHLIKAYSWQ